MTAQELKESIMRLEAFADGFKSGVQSLGKSLAEMESAKEAQKEPT